MKAAPPFEEIVRVALAQSARLPLRAGEPTPRPDVDYWSVLNLERWRQVYEAMARTDSVRVAADQIPVSYTRVQQIGKRLWKALVHGGFVMAGRPFGEAGCEDPFRWCPPLEDGRCLVDDRLRPRLLPPRS